MIQPRPALVKSVKNKRMALNDMASPLISMGQNIGMNSMKFNLNNNISTAYGYYSREFLKNRKESEKKLVRKYRMRVI